MKPSQNVVCLGASTGGIDALIEVLSSLESVKASILIVQHTGIAHFEGLIRTLEQHSPLPVLPGVDGCMIESGKAYVACDGQSHLVLRKSSRLKLECCHSEPISGHRPSIDALFKSATHLGRQAVGCLMTGMGRDGAAGLLAMRKAGAFTIVQDAETSVVYGMPKAAFEIGAAKKQLALNKIGPEIVNHVNNNAPLMKMTK